MSLQISINPVFNHESEGKLDMQVQFFSSLWVCYAQCQGPVIPGSPTTTLDSPGQAELKQCIFFLAVDLPFCFFCYQVTKESTSRCCKAVPGAWVLMPAPLFVSRLNL